MQHFSFDGWICNMKTHHNLDSGNEYYNLISGSPDHVNAAPDWTHTACSQ
jgi:hypothetical protein